MTNLARPFETFTLGPVIMKTVISDHLHTILLNASNKVRKSKKLKLKNDYRKNLAGNLTEEYNFNNAFTPQAEKIVDDELRSLAAFFTKTSEFFDPGIDPFKNSRSFSASDFIISMF